MEKVQQKIVIFLTAEKIPPMITRLYVVPLMFIYVWRRDDARVEDLRVLSPSPGLAVQRSVMKMRSRLWKKRRRRK